MERCRFHVDVMGGVRREVVGRRQGAGGLGGREGARAARM